MITSKNDFSYEATRVLGPVVFVVRAPPCLLGDERHLSRELKDCNTAPSAADAPSKTVLVNTCHDDRWMQICRLYLLRTAAFGLAIRLSVAETNTARSMARAAPAFRSSCMLALLATIVFISGSLLGVVFLRGTRLAENTASQPSMRAAAGPTVRPLDTTEQQPDSPRAEIEYKVEALENELQAAQSALLVEQRSSAQLAVQLAAARAAAAPSPPAVRPSQPTGVVNNHVWMMIAIPTVHREGQDYLNPTLAAILQQLPPDARHPLHGAVRIVVADNTHGDTQHVAFEKAKAALSDPSHPHFGVVAFVRNPCPRSEAAHAKRHSPNVAGPTVRQQTRDVIWLLHAVSVLAAGGSVADIPRAPPGSMAGEAAQPPPVQGTAFPQGAMHASHVLLMEDDFRLCPHGLLALAHLTAKVASMPGVAPMPAAQATVHWDTQGVQAPPAVQTQHGAPWLLLRVCYGLNGAVLHTRDVPALAAYLASRLQARPPDHLLVEWFAGETQASAAYAGRRGHFTYRYNLLDHFGRQSSLRAAPQGTFGACYDPLDTGNLFEVEAWKPQECGHDDMQPCRAADDMARWAPLHLKDAAKGIQTRVGGKHAQLQSHLATGTVRGE